MSCDYADGLSPYNHKGILGLPEKFDSLSKFVEKCSMLTQLIKDAKHIVVHTGAGISTSAGIPDFRGPNGVWTLEEKGLKPNISVSFNDAKPTKTHMALKHLVDQNVIKYIISQNIDGLHLKSGLKRSNLAELHGNMFIEQCNTCKKQFVRSSPATTVGQKDLGKQCYGERFSGRRCRGKLHDIILDWEHSLPDDDLEMADMHSSIADLSICLGTTLQIVPSGILPLNTLRYGGKLVICNLQPTKHDNKADLIINGYVDEILEKVMKELGQNIPDYCEKDNPVLDTSGKVIEWTICKKELSIVKSIFKKQCDGVVKKRSLVKNVLQKIKKEDGRGRRKRKKEVDVDDKSKLNGVIKKEEKEIKVDNNKLTNKSVESNDCESETKIIKLEDLNVTVKEDILDRSENKSIKDEVDDELPPKIINNEIQNV